MPRACAPHVRRTGEIGLVKILDSIRHKDGVRVTMLAGRAALEDYRMKARQVAGAGAALVACGIGLSIRRRRTR